MRTARHLSEHYRAAQAVCARMLSQMPMFTAWPLVVVRARSHASVLVAGAFVGVGEERQQLAAGPLAQEGLGQRLVDLDSVAVAAALLVLEDVSSFHELCDDAECGPFGDAERG